MSQQQESAIHQQPEDPKSKIEALRETVVNAVVDSEANFNETFTALSQVVAGFIFDFLLLTEGELTEQSVKGAIAKFYNNTDGFAAVAFKNIQAEIEDAKPRIIV